MGRVLGRRAAFVALWRALTVTRRDGPGLGRRLAALPRMIVASLRRRDPRYDGLGRLVLMVFALLYLAWPVELIPELFLGPLGLIDDAVVVAWLAGAVISETGRFLEWEAVRRADEATAGRSLPAAPRNPPPGAETVPDQVVERPVREP